MKKLLCSLAILVISAPVFAQWTTSGNNTLHTNSGNVGIGTNNPQGKLHIDVPLDNSVSAITIGNGNTTGNLNVPIGAATGGYNIDFKTWRDVVPDQIGARIRAERINNYQQNNALIQGMDLVFFTSPGGEHNQLIEKMRVDRYGNVGIGTSSPDAKLSVKGTIHTQEVKVDMIGWADYVFKPSYKLPSLNKVKTYIDRNKHLPDMPSEAEVTKDGVNLGAMNRLLLKKVEELTIYLINLKEENDNFRSRLNRIEKNINNKNITGL